MPQYLQETLSHNCLLFTSVSLYQNQGKRHNRGGVFDPNYQEEVGPLLNLEASIYLTPSDLWCHFLVLPLSISIVNEKLQHTYPELWAQTP